MKIINFCLISFIIISCSTSTKNRSSTDWKKSSEELAKSYAESIGHLYPEYMANIGYEKFDSMVTPYSKTLEKERYKEAYLWQKRLERYIEGQSHPELRTDAKILLEQVNLEMESIEVAREMGIVPFLPLTQFIYSNIKSLLEEGVDQAKVRNALIRFRSYVRGTDQGLPLVDGFMAHLYVRLDDLQERRTRGFWPLKNEVEEYLKDSNHYLEEIENLLKKSWEGNEWVADLNELKIQDEGYRTFLKKKILPYTRSSTETPEKLFRFVLKDYGIHEDPKVLINIAKNDYKETYAQFEILGREIAKKYELSSDQPLAVVHFLKSRAIGSDEELLKFYNKTSDRLYTLMKEKDILSMKKRPNFIIRFGNRAEMQSIPAPHFNPPPLLGKKKIPGQFVIPMTSGGYGMEDYSFPEAILNLTAHEGIPGHALQFHAIQERGMTSIRAHFAFNSANVEGWGLFAEDMIYPYLSIEEKFITLQRRLWRQARMFLDPELNLGLIPPKRIADVYVRELGFTEAFAQSELKRYSYIIPGQAGAYYYGMKKLTELKSELEKTKASFTVKCYNDALLDLGVLPLKEIRHRLTSEFECDGGI